MLPEQIPKQTQYMPAMPLGAPQTIPTTADPIDARIAKYMSIERNITINPKFENVPNITGNMRAACFDFPDDLLLNVPAYQLYRVEIADLAHLGRATIPMLSSGFTEQGIGALFLLAYNLRVPTQGVPKYVFPVHDLGSIEDLDVFDLSDNLLIKVRDTVKLPETVNPDREAMFYSFIAASTFRLFIKSPDNYLKAFNHICEGFSKFYRVSAPVSLTAPHIDAVKILQAHILINPRCKATLFRILYLGGGEECENLMPGMRRFLYDMHLTHTGLHTFEIFLKLCHALNCETNVLLSILNINEYKQQINALVKLIGIMNSTEENTKRKMWRFGRVFDHTFMAPLQTKECPNLTYTLASALKKVASKSNENILDIVQLGDVSEERRRMLDAVAEKLVRMVSLSCSRIL